MSPLASLPSQPEANVAARPQHLNINWATGRVREGEPWFLSSVVHCKYILMQILQKKQIIPCTMVKEGETHAVRRVRRKTQSWEDGGRERGRLTSGTFLLNSLLSSTRCLWECSLSSCRPASSDATEFSSLYKHTKERETVRGSEWSWERRHFREPANAHPVKLRVYINKNTLLNINNVILHDLTAVILTASPGP